MRDSNLTAEERALKNTLKKRDTRHYAKPNELTDDMIAMAVKWRIGGIPYSQIAKKLSTEFGTTVNDTGTFRATIKNAVDAYIRLIQTKAEITYGLDYLRIEAAINAQYELVLGGSDKHFLAMLKGIKAKQEILYKMLELRAQRGQLEEAPTITTDGDEYMLALQAMNSDSPIAHIMAPVEKPSVTVDENLTEEQVEQLRDIAHDLELNIQIDTPQSSANAEVIDAKRTD